MAEGGDQFDYFETESKRPCRTIKPTDKGRIYHIDIQSKLFWKCRAEINWLIDETKFLLDTGHNEDKLDEQRQKIQVVSAQFSDIVNKLHSLGDSGFEKVAFEVRSMMTTVLNDINDAR